jgi:hypothetical protein
VNAAAAIESTTGATRKETSMNRAPLLEGLESRVLLSSTPVFNATVAADRLAVRADLLKFRSDVFACAATLLGDRTAILKNIAKGDTSLVTPFQTLRADLRAMHTALREDRLKEAADALADESTIKLDLRQILLDKGNPTAEAADHDKLHSDRIQLQNDLIAGLDARIATRQSYLTTISDDVDAIVTAANNDPNASDALKAAVATFAADRTNCLTTLNADLQTIDAARAQLVADLTAAQSS